MGQWDQLGMERNDNTFNSAVKNKQLRVGLPFFNSGWDQVP